MRRFVQPSQFSSVTKRLSPTAEGGQITPPYLSVWHVMQRATAAVQEALPSEVWIKGEVVGYKGPKGNGHWFDLVERAGTRDAVLGAVVWSDQWSWIAGKLRAAGLALADGQEMLFRGSIYLYPKGGRLTFRINDVYPELTLGQIEQRRRAVLEQLEREGLLEINQQRPMPELPLRVGLISSLRGDGMGDFQRVLGRSGFGFTIAFCNTPVQGPDTEATVCAALKRLIEYHASHRLDVVCIVRGGGSATDLGWWNSYPIAAAVARLPVPVISGIGHDSDRVVLDDVAHTRAATPTGAAEILVGLMRAAEADVANLRQGLVEMAQVSLARQRDALAATRSAAADLAAATWAKGRAAYRDGVAQLQALAAHPIRAEARCLADCCQATAAHARLAVDRCQGGVGELGVQVGVAAKSQVRGQARDQECLRDNLADAVARAAERARRRLEQLGDLVDAHDPQRVLQRGYSITRDADGRALKDAGPLRPGTDVLTVLARGTLRSTITEAAIPPTGDPT